MNNSNIVHHAADKWCLSATARPRGDASRRIRLLLSLCMAGGLAMPLFAAPPAAADGPPNVLLILADDVGCETLGCYGGESYPTPRIDALAKSGLRFTHAFSMPVCHPTRVCLLSGRYPFQLQHPRWGSYPRDAEDQTLAHVMKRAGYTTAVAGKWQLALLRKDPRHPHRLGFDDYCLFGWHEGPRYHDPLIWQNGVIRDDTTGEYGPQLYVDFLLDFMKRQDGRPFFAFYSMALCHDMTDDLPHPVPYGPGKDHYDTYREMMAQMDRQVGRLIDGLQQQGLRERTVVIFTTDNGTAASSKIQAKKGGGFVYEQVFSTQAGRRIRGGKGSLTDAGTNVPLIVSRPGAVAAGGVNGSLIDFSDFLPTVAELAGGEPPQGVELPGRSFAPLLAGKPHQSREFVFAEHRGKSWVRTRRFKLYDDGRLFDLQTDPRERHPIDPAADPAGVKAARKRLQRFAEGLQVK